LTSRPSAPPLPPPPPPGALETYLDQWRKGWRWHANAFFGGAEGAELAPGNIALGLRDVLVTLIGLSAHRNWLTDPQMRYDPATGERLSEEDRRIIAEAGAAARNLERQLRRRRDFLEAQLVQAEILDRRIAEAGAAIDRLEKSVLETLPALTECLHRCGS